MRRFFSPRVTIALGIAGVTVLSVSALDNAAAFTDTANAASSFSSAAKLCRRRRRPQLVATTSRFPVRTLEFGCT